MFFLSLLFFCSGYYSICIEMRRGWDAMGELLALIPGTPSSFLSFFLLSTPISCLCCCCYSAHHCRRHPPHFWRTDCGAIFHRPGRLTGNERVWDISSSTLKIKNVKKSIGFDSASPNDFSPTTSAPRRGAFSISFLSFGLLCTNYFVNYASLYSNQSAFFPSLWKINCKPSIRYLKSDRSIIFFIFRRFYSTEEDKEVGLS